MSIHAFAGRTDAGSAATYYGNSTPIAGDQTIFSPGDSIILTPFPFATAVTPGLPSGWMCIVGGVGPLSQWIEFGSTQSVPQASVTAPATVVTTLTSVPGALLKFTIPFSAIPAGASPVQISLFTPPAKSLVERVFIKHSVAFSGGGIASMNVRVGLAATTAFYAALFDVFQAVTGSAFEVVFPNTIDNFTAPTAVVVTITSTGANPSLATAGSVDIYVWVTTARS